jgi:spore coat protein A
VNLTDGIHPIHVHLVNFLVLDRYDQYRRLLNPLPTDFGLKDTVLVDAKQTARIIMRFEPFAGDSMYGTVIV